MFITLREKKRIEYQYAMKPGQHTLKMVKQFLVIAINAFC